MAETDVAERPKTRRVQVANLAARRQRPGDSAASRQADEGPRHQRGRHHRDQGQALHRGPGYPSLRRGRGARHRSARRARARQCRSRLGRVRRDSQSQVEAGDPGRFCSRPGPCPAAGFCRGLEAHLRREAPLRGRHRCYGRAPAGQLRYSRHGQGDAQRSRIRSSGSSAGGRHGRAQRHRPYRRHHRRRASARIPRQAGRPARRRHLRRSWGNARHDRSASRDGRAAASAPRAFPASRSRPAQGRASPRPSRNRQDPAGAGGRQREQRPFCEHRRSRDHGLRLR
jgi:hypothetical protein